MSTILTLAIRDYIERVKQKGFIAGTIIGMLAIIGIGLLPLFGNALLNSLSLRLAVLGTDAPVVAAVANSLTPKSAIGGYRVSVLSMRVTGPSLPATARRQVNAGKFDAALVAYRDRAGTLSFAFYPRTQKALEGAAGIRQRLLRAVILASAPGSAAQRIKRGLNFGFKIVSLNPRYRNETEEAVAQGLVYVLLVLMYMAVILYAVFVGQGVVEEKSNRVMEIMIGAVRPAQLLAGKVLGIGTLALCQLVVFIATAMVMLVFVGIHYAQALAPQATQAAIEMSAQAGGAPAAAVPLATLAYLVIFFFLGFFSYAAMAAGVGALASKAEDVQSANTIFVLPIVAAYLLSIFAINDPDKPIFVWTSLVPLLSPMVMFTRVAISSVPAWQIAASIIFSIAAIVALTLAAAKVYRVGVLMYGKPPSLREIWRALRSPA